MLVLALQSQLRNSVQKPRVSQRALHTGQSYDVTFPALHSQEAFQEQGRHLSEAGIKPHLSEAPWNRWMCQHQLSGMSVTMVGGQKNLQLAGVCQFLVGRKTLKCLQMFLSADPDFTAVVSLSGRPVGWTLR